MLAKEFMGQFECVAENTEKYITFSVTIERGLDNGKSITNKIKFVDSFRFMSSSLSNLVNNLPERVHSDKCTDRNSCLDYMSFRGEQRSCTQLIFRCFECKKYNEKDFNKEVIKRFANIYEFCNKDINKFILLLRKGVYPYEYMDSWERFGETSSPDKEAFYSSLNMENTTDVDYRHTKKTVQKS